MGVHMVPWSFLLACVVDPGATPGDSPGPEVALESADTSAPSDPADPTGPEPCRLAPADVRVEIDSPSDGAVLRSPWVPLVVPLGSRKTALPDQVCVDGWRVEDPLGLVVKGDEDRDHGFDYIATLDLLDLAPGEHLLQVQARRGRHQVVRAESRFAVDRPAHRVRLWLTDGTGQPLSARVVVTDATGAFVDLGSPDDAAVDAHGRDVDLHSFFVLDGEGAVDLDPGRYRLLVVRSVRDELLAIDLDLDRDLDLHRQLLQPVDLPGHLSADLHVHTGRSYDSMLPDRIRLSTLKAVGLDVVVATDHDEIVDLAPALALMGGAGPTALPGNEASVFTCTDGWDGIGHFNAFPLAGEDQAALPPRCPSSVAALLDAYRERQARAPHTHTGSDLLLQLNHARGIQFFPDGPHYHRSWPLFNDLGFDPAVPVGEGDNAWMTEPEPETGTTALDFDLLELLNRFSWQGYLAVRADWFALLSQGYRITATGNSDSHALQVELAGFPTNLVRVGPGSVDPQAFVDALRDGRVLVSSGPVVELTMFGDHGLTGQPGDLVTATRGAVAEVRVQAPAWVPVDEVRLVVNGEVLVTELLAPREDEVLDTVLSWPLDLPADAWVVAEAGWPLEAGDAHPQVGGDYALAVPGYVPVGFTNPVRVDADGDGEWGAPGL